jgi:hypothetical protein
MRKGVHLVGYSRVYVYNYTYRLAELLFKLLAPLFRIKAIKKETTELNYMIFFTLSVT